jgi:hypothetical protein
VSITRRHPRAVVAGLAAILVLVPVATAGYGVWAQRIRPHASVAPLSAHALTGACGSTRFHGWNREYFPFTAAYDGSAPHPVHVVVEIPKESGSPDSSYVSAGWRTTPGDFVADVMAPERVQLVACLAWTRGGARIAGCDYEDHRAVPVRTADYDLTVYEARTGEEVGTGRIDGASSDQCPTEWIFQGKDPTIFAAPTTDQLRHALRRFTDVDK